jgi:hypothetical protein
MDQLTLDKNLTICKIWDLGPRRPVAPEKPQEPSDKLKGVDLDLAKIHYQDALLDYAIALRAYGAEEKAYTAWRQANGGPIEIERNPVVAKEAIARDPKRYTQTLPKGTKPGFGHANAQQQQAERAKAMAADAAKDPHFGGTHAQASP